jgi:hypothetical protein
MITEYLIPMLLSAMKNEPPTMISQPALENTYKYLSYGIRKFEFSTTLYTFLTAGQVPYFHAFWNLVSTDGTEFISVMKEK